MSDASHAPRPFGLALALVTLAAGLAGCGSELTLPPPTLETVERTITLWAMSGTDVVTPSAYNMIIQTEIRTDRTPDFDFAFDIGVDSVLRVGDQGDTVAVLFPPGAVGLSFDGGLQTTTIPYDSLLLAPDGGYKLDRGVVVDSGSVVLARSRVQTCNFGFRRGLYAKLSVLALDRGARTITLRMRLNPNCGYRGLVSGVPPN